MPDPDFVGGTLLAHEMAEISAFTAPGRPPKNMHTVFVADPIQEAFIERLVRRGVAGGHMEVLRNGRGLAGDNLLEVKVADFSPWTGSILLRRPGPNRL